MEGLESVNFPFDAYVDVDKFYTVKQSQGPIGKWVVEGYASTSDLDSQGDIITPEAIAMGAESLKKYNTVLFNHDPDRPIGIVEKAEAQDRKLFVKIVISKSEPKLWEQIKDGTLSKFSIRGKILDHSTKEDPVTKKEILVIKAMELHEVSLVSVPANPEARSLAWYVEKAYREDLEKKSIRKPGETIQQCVSRKIPLLISEGKSKAQAAAIAFSMCGESKKYEEFIQEFPWLEEIFDDMEKKAYPWDKCIADQKARGYSAERAAKICNAIKNRTVAHMIEEWDMAKTEDEAINIIAHKMEEDKLYEYAWEKFTELQKAIVEKDEHGQGTMDECMKYWMGQGMSKEKAHEKCMSMGKSNEDEIEGGTNVDKTDEKEESVKKDEGKQVIISADALSEVITQLKEMVKEAKTNSDAVQATKSAIEKMVTDINEVVKKIPLRQADETKEEDKREHKEEKDAVKSLTESEDYKKAKPGDKLGRVFDMVFSAAQRASEKGGE